MSAVSRLGDFAQPGLTGSVVYWRLRAAGPGDNDAALVNKILRPSERQVLAGLKSDKRRRDWLLGRLAAKELLQRLAQQQTWQTADLSDITIDSRADGSPAAGPPGLPPLTLSISHSHDHAVCAVVLEPDRPLGVDLEWVEPRARGFAADFFTTVEQLLVATAGEAAQPAIVTAIWSAKEAALKAVRLGLTADTRSVSIRLSPEEASPDEWAPLAVGWDEARLTRPLPELTGWWRLLDGFALTLVTAADDRPLIRQVD